MSELNAIWCRLCGKPIERQLWNRHCTSPEHLIAQTKERRLNALVRDVFAKHRRAPLTEDTQHMGAVRAELEQHDRDIDAVRGISRRIPDALLTSSQRRKRYYGTSAGAGAAHRGVPR